MQKQNRMYKILFVIPSLKTGGTNSSLSALYSNIKKQYDITVLTLSNQRNAEYNFDEVVRYLPFIISAFHVSVIGKEWYKCPTIFVLKAIRTIIRKLLRYDILNYLYRRVVHTIEKEHTYDFVVAFEESYPTKFVSYFKNMNKIAWIHCDYNKYCPLGISEEAIYSQYKNIVCVSKYTSQLFISRYPRLETKVSFVYNLIDVQSIIVKSMRAIDDNRFERKKGFVIISAGRIDPVKRFSFIPKIAKDLIDRGLYFQWYILGPIVVRDEYDKVETNIEKFGVNNYVHYLGNKINPYSYFANSDLYVCTSESEACPMVFNEAMILNTPVITANFGSASEFIHNNKNGVVCNMDELAEKIFGVLTDDKIYQGFQKELAELHSFNSSILNNIHKLFS